MKPIQATNGLLLELWPASDASGHPVVAIRNLAAEAGGEHQTVVVHPHETRHLIDALAEAAVELAEMAAM